jgi:hypothetical protein
MTTVIVVARLVSNTISNILAWVILDFSKIFCIFNTGKSLNKWKMRNI